MGGLKYRGLPDNDLNSAYNTGIYNGNGETGTKNNPFYYSIIIAIGDIWASMQLAYNLADWSQFKLRAYYSNNWSTWKQIAFIS